MMVEEKTHIVETLRYMDQYLRHFHQYKDIFLGFRAYKTTLQAGNDRPKAILQSNPPVRMCNEPEHPRTVWSSVSHQWSLQEIDEIQEASHVHLMKMYLLTHFWQHAEGFGKIQMFSWILVSLHTKAKPRRATNHPIRLTQ